MRSSHLFSCYLLAFYHNRNQKQGQEAVCAAGGDGSYHSQIIKSAPLTMASGQLRDLFTAFSPHLMWHHVCHFPTSCGSRTSFSQKARFPHSSNPSAMRSQSIFNPPPHTLCRTVENYFIFVCIIIWLISVSHAKLQPPWR